MVSPPAFQWRLNLNTAPAELLSCAPGLTPTAVRSILFLRRSGSIGTIEQVLTSLSREDRRALLGSYGPFGHLVTMRPPLFLLDAVGFGGTPALSSRITAAVTVGGRSLVTIWREAE